MLYKLINVPSINCDCDQVDIAARKLSDCITRLRRQEGWKPIGSHTVTVIQPSTGSNSYVLFTQMLEKQEPKDYTF